MSFLGKKKLDKLWQDHCEEYSQHLSELVFAWADPSDVMETQYWAELLLLNSWFLLKEQVLVAAVAKGGLFSFI